MHFNPQFSSCCRFHHSDEGDQEHHSKAQQEFDRHLDTHDSQGLLLESELKKESLRFLPLWK